MKTYDLTHPLTSGMPVYPGTEPPRFAPIADILADHYREVAFSMTSHVGTHIDAPYHFFEDGETVERLALSKTVGYAYVTEQEGAVDAEGARTILETARNACAESAKRILMKGRAFISAEAAEVFAEANVELFGNESQTVGPENAPMQVHKILLGKGIVLLEGIRLGEVPEGVYFLSAQPLSLAGADGSPCRAVLVSF